MPDTDLTAQFVFTLAQASTRTVTLSWETRDGTAVANIDYVPASGQLVFQPGETSKSVTIQVLQPPTEERKFFTVAITDAVNATVDETEPGQVVIMPNSVFRGKRGFKGDRGQRGMSAYEEAIANGSFVGTYDQWLVFVGNGKVVWLADYAVLRAYAGFSPGVRIIGKGIEGDFAVDASDISSADDGGTIIIDALGRRWKRLFVGGANPLWFSSDATGQSSSLDAFNRAAAVNGQVNVTKGTYLIDAPTVSATWTLQVGVVITGLPTVGGNSLMDLSRLTGVVNALQAGGRIKFRMGDGNPWLERDIRNFSESLANAVFLSSEGRIGALFGSRASGNNSANMATIGISAYGVNDNPNVPKTTWCFYSELLRFAGCGPAIGAEMDGVNLGDTYVLDPYKQMAAYDATKAHTVHLWLSCGGGDSGLAAGANNMSAAIVTLPNSKKFDKGWVVRNGSIETGEIIAAPLSYKYTWYSAPGVINSFIDHRSIDQRTSIDSALGNAWFSRKNRSTGATIALDTIHQQIFYSGETPGASYTAGNFTVRQRTAFASSHARHSVDIQARNNDGSYSELSLNGVADKTFAPIADATLNFGGPSNRINNSYYAVAPTVTSDERMKLDIRQIDDACLDAWQLIDYRQWKNKEAVDEKGTDARWHTGLIAQRIKSAFEEAGLDAADYGLLCYDEWQEQEEVIHEFEAELDEEGNVVRPARAEIVQPYRPAGSRYGVRYEEALAMEAALMRRTTDRLNKRLIALEAMSGENKGKA